MSETSHQSSASSAAQLDVRGRGATDSLIALLARPISDRDCERAAIHVLDWIGCAAAGALTLPGLAMGRFAKSLSAGPCRTVGGHALVSRDAALVNGSVGNVLEMDDFFRAALVHPGPVVVPAALAVAQETGANGRATLEAIIRGFEVMIRIGCTVGMSHYQRFHNTATCGVFGAATAAGSLLDLDDDQMADALGNAGTQASGLWQCRLEDTMSKQLHNGRAAQSGLLAAKLAAVGFTGAHAILEGNLGFWHGLCPDAQPERLLEASDGPWLIHETSFKPWPACRHTHPTIDAALALRDRIDPGAIEQILVAGYHDAVAICDNPCPQTPVQAKFSLQHAAAVVLLRGRPVLEDFDMAMVAQAEVKSLRSKVVLHEDPGLSQRYPARFGGVMQITLNDGRTLSHAVDDALGDPENPIDAHAVADKTRMLLGAAGYGDAATERMIGAARKLAEATDLNALMSGLQ